MKNENEKKPFIKLLNEWEKYYENKNKQKNEETLKKISNLEKRNRTLEVKSNSQKIAMDKLNRRLNRVENELTTLKQRQSRN